MQTFFQKYVFVKFENLKYHQKSSIQGRGREKSLKRKLIVYVFLFFVQNFKHIRYRVTELFDFKVVHFYLGHPVHTAFNNPYRTLWVHIAGNTHHDKGHDELIIKMSLRTIDWVEYGTTG